MKKLIKKLSLNALYDSSNLLCRVCPAELTVQLNSYSEPGNYAVLKTVDPHRHVSELSSADQDPHSFPLCL